MLLILLQFKETILAYYELNFNNILKKELFFFNCDLIMAI